MREFNNEVQLSASDLVNHLNCHHLTELDLNVANGVIGKPSQWSPLLDMLRERGRRHEAAYVDYLREQGRDVVTIDGIEVNDEALVETHESMVDGREVIIQPALHADRWAGRADVFFRVDKPSGLGSWSYEIIDTKLSRETKGGSVLQLCLYADLLGQAQGAPPESIHVVSPWTDFELQTFRYADFAAFYRRAKKAAEQATEGSTAFRAYPDPKEHCDVCRWRQRCEQRRRDDDHLCLVAGISQSQITELQSRDIGSTATLATMPVPITWTPARGAPLSYQKIREQARIQVKSRETGQPQYELLPIAPEAGLTQLPEPSAGDMFFDIEGDPFVGEHGLEYLFGYYFQGDNAQMQYIGSWAFDCEGEKAAFEQFVDFAIDRLQTYPDLHIYHFAPYEPSTLKRLMGRYASREDEIDALLRGQVFVDLYSVVRNGIRVGVESYSIKKLEPLYGFVRDTELDTANVALASIQAALEFGEANDIADDPKVAVQSYNRDDCVSTQALRDWLEARRAELVSSGAEVPRPPPGDGQPSEQLSEQQQRVQELVERLTANVPVAVEERTDEQHARWILAHLLEWHRREEKSSWWEYFRLKDLTVDELLNERAALSHLQFIDVVDHTPRRIPIHRYRFEQQDTDLRGEEELKTAGGGKLGTAVAVSRQNRTIDIRKQKATADTHPQAVYAHTMIQAKEQAVALFRLGEYVADNGLAGDGQYGAARALLLRERPPIGGQSLRQPGENLLDSALRLTDSLGHGILPIQGPPGTGKSFTGARMICRLVEQGKTVGITANSHKVIRNLISKVLEAAEEQDSDIRCVHKGGDPGDDTEGLIVASKNEHVFNLLQSGDCQVAGGTSFLWARQEAFDALDVLVVDEAAQMSLANTVAVAQSTETLILIGDPQQLDQPTQGTHPDGTGVSSLEHILGGESTIASNQGLFLEASWRLHPAICGFISELFYDDKLSAQQGCSKQAIQCDIVTLDGSGLRYMPVVHQGNQSSSIEEADAVTSLVNRILAGHSKWTNRLGDENTITIEDIVIITPYNAQVFEIQQRLPDAHVGTVDKFQGQEAPIAIYSVATSSHVDAPRGMEFLYSSNRFNVAISRAQCLAILVASPQIFEAECKTPQQMRLANAFCRYLECGKTANMIK